MMNDVQLYAGDNRESLRRLIDEGVRVHSVVTDPPYGLVSIQKRFGKQGAAAARTEGNDGSFARLSGGFMGKAWDGTGIERDPEFWKLIYDILLPGGYVFAFSGSRTGHWQACAMELAGFVLHPMHGWVSHSGFPKAHAADKAIDKMGGADRLKALNQGWEDLARHIRDRRKASGLSVAEMASHFPEFKSVSANWERLDAGNRIPNEISYDRLIALIGIEDLWRDMVRTNDLRSIDKGVVSDRRDDNTVYGLGHNGNAYQSQSSEAAEWEGWAYGTQAQKPALEPIYLAQKPFSEKTGAANLLKHGVGAVNIDGCRVPLGADDALQAGVTHTERKLDTADNEGSWGFKAVDRIAGLGRHPSNLILDGSPEVVAMFPISKGQQGAVRGTEQSRTGDENTNCYGKFTGRVPASPRNDSGSAARFYHQFPLTDDDYNLAIAAGIISEDQGDCIISNPKAGKLDRAGSKHPTVKPIALMQYLIRHITPRGGVVLDPFAGSGTTAEAARREGFNCILMEAEQEYIDFLCDRFTIAPEDDDLLLGPAPAWNQNDPDILI